MKISYVKISELARLADVNKTIVSRYFKTASDKEVVRNNNRIIGISPEAVTNFLSKNGINYFQRGGGITFC